MARALSISEENAVGVLLSPHGNPAEDKFFVPISYRDFADAVFGVVAGSRRTELSRAAASILGFVSYYGRGI
jgi:hypothetical protein